MSETKGKGNYSTYQQKIIKRYYDNADSIGLQRLSELVGEIYLAEGKKKQDKAWEAADKAMQKLGVAASRIEHLLQKRDPTLVAELVRELTGKQD